MRLRNEDEDGQCLCCLLQKLFDTVRRSSLLSPFADSALSWAVEEFLELELSRLTVGWLGGAGNETIRALLE